uniref:Uncharacterized protein n=1 Tax=Anopheles farauti TaxID=69004 RepID=A0A182Q4Z6_9DIPT
MLVPVTPGIIADSTAPPPRPFFHRCIQHPLSVCPLPNVANVSFYCSVFVVSRRVTSCQIVSSPRTAGAGIVVTKTATTAAIAVVAPTARNAVAMATGSSLNNCVTTVAGAVCSGPSVTSQAQQPILTLAANPSSAATTGMKVNQPTLQHQRIQSMHHIHHHHHHQLINGIPAAAGQRMPAAAAAAATTHNPAAGWPMVEPVFHFGPGFELETRPFCPTHTPPSEHVVLFHVRPGVAVTFQIAGNRETIRGREQRQPSTSRSQTQSSPHQQQQQQVAVDGTQKGDKFDFQMDLHLLAALGDPSRSALAYAYVRRVTPKSPR